MTARKGAAPKRTAKVVRTYVSGAGSTFDPLPRPVRVRDADVALELHRTRLARLMVRVAKTIVFDSERRVGS